MPIIKIIWNEANLANDLKRKRMITFLFLNFTKNKRVQQTKTKPFEKRTTTNKPVHKERL